MVHMVVSHQDGIDTIRGNPFGFKHLLKSFEAHSRVYEQASHTFPSPEASQKIAVSAAAAGKAQESGPQFRVIEQLSHHSSQNFLIIP